MRRSFTPICADYREQLDDLERAPGLSSGLARWIHLGNSFKYFLEPSVPPLHGMSVSPSTLLTQGQRSCLIHFSIRVL